MPAKLIHKNLVGAYVYEIYVDGIVRYIGKGRGYRMVSHLGVARNIIRRRANGEKVRANRFYNKLAKAIQNGADIKPLVIVCNLSDQDAFDRECLEISRVPAGQLWNLKEGGGDGDRNFTRALWATPEYRERVSAAIREGKRKPHFRESARATAKRHWDDPEFYAKQIAREKAMWADPVLREARIAILKKVWSSPELSAKKSKLVKSQWTPERRAAMSENRRKAWADPEFKARASASIGAAKRKIKCSTLALPVSLSDPD